MCPLTPQPQLHAAVLAAWPPTYAEEQRVPPKSFVESDVKPRSQSPAHLLPCVEGSYLGDARARIHALLQPRPPAARLLDHPPLPQRPAGPPHDRLCQLSHMRLVHSLPRGGQFLLLPRPAARQRGRHRAPRVPQQLVELLPPRACRQHALRQRGLASQVVGHVCLAGQTVEASWRAYGGAAAAAAAAPGLGLVGAAQDPRKTGAAAAAAHPAGGQRGAAAAAGAGHGPQVAAGCGRVLQAREGPQRVGHCRQGAAGRGQRELGWAKQAARRVPCRSAASWDAATIGGTRRGCSSGGPCVEGGRH